MNIIGRTTKDAAVHNLKDGRPVVHFSIAVNDYYRPKGDERVKATTFYDCAYWLSPKLAQYLKKGTLVEVSGRVYISTYLGADGSPRASLKCDVSSVHIHAWPKEAKAAASTGASVPDDTEADDLPF